MFNKVLTYLLTYLATNRTETHALVDNNIQASRKTFLFNSAYTSHWQCAIGLTVGSALQHAAVIVTVNVPVVRTGIIKMFSSIACTVLASCLIYARALLEYVIIIMWLRSVIKMLQSVKFAEDKVLTFLIL